MSQPIVFGELDFSLVTSDEETKADFTKEKSFRMLVLGDFSGRANRGLVDLGTGEPSLKPRLVDRDTLDDLFAGLGVKVELPLLGKKNPPVTIEFSGLDDFHPETLFQNLELFEALRQMRRSLQDPEGCTAFLKELHSKPSNDKKSKSQPETTVDTSTSGNLLDQIIEQSESESQQITGPVTASSEMDCFLQSIVQSHLVAKPQPEQQEMLESIDAATGELMRMILHNRDFQAIEAAWRGLSFLVKRLETDSELKLFMLDISKEELTEALTQSTDLRSTSLYKLLVEQAVGMVGGEAWSVVAGNYTFEKTSEDIDVLGRLSKIAKAAGCPFVSAAGDQYLGVGSLAATPDPDDWQLNRLGQTETIDKYWQALRCLPEACYIGLAIPRFILRLPYGIDTEPIELFSFEEMGEGATHEQYLWGNPCFAILLLLGEAFSRNGWKMQPGDMQEISDLPLHVYKKKGETHLQPCAEVLLSHRAAEVMVEKGLMPLLSFVNQDLVRVGRFQSIADPAAKLAGPWS